MPPAAALARVAPRVSEVGDLRRPTARGRCWADPGSAETHIFSGKLTSLS